MLSAPIPADSHIGRQALPACAALQGGAAGARR